jgi:hypothetical protein
MNGRSPMSYPLSLYARLFAFFVVLVAGCDQESETEVQATPPVAQQQPVPIAKAGDLKTASYLKKYCFECHRGETAEGQVNLATFAQERSIELLFDVYDQSVLESMPPEDSQQPSAAERSDFIRELESMLKEKGHDRKVQPGFGNYVDHEALFTPNNLEPASPKRVWRIDPSAMAEIGNKLAGRTVYRDKGQSVGKEHPSFTYRAPAHTFRDYDATSYFENTTTELALAYAKQIADYMEEIRFQPHQRRLDEADKLGTKQQRETRRNLIGPLDRIGETYRLLFDREIPESERKALADLDEHWAVAALILKSDAVFRMEVDMDAYELARTLGFALSEEGPDPELFKAVANRPLEEVLDERMQTDAFHWRLVRFLREYFEYDNAPNVFKDPEDQPKEEFKRGQQYHPIWHVADADHFCLRIVREDAAVLRQLLTSTLHSVQGGLNSLHIKILGRGASNGYRSGYHGIYGIAEEDLPPWRADHEVPHRKGMLHHPAWLIAFSDNEKNQAIQRGRWITTKLLGGYVPDAPVEVDASLPDDPSLTLRQKMRVTRESKCWACHRHMDDLGLPFEQFDFLGHYRAEELGKPVDVTGFALGAEIKDPYLYVETLADSRRVQQVFLRHAFRFFMGRNESLNDANTLIAMDEAFQPKGSLKAALRVLFLSDAYRQRH